MQRLITSGHSALSDLVLTNEGRHARHVVTYAYYHPHIPEAVVLTSSSSSASTASSEKWIWRKNRKTMLPNSCRFISCCGKIAAGYGEDRWIEKLIMWKVKSFRYKDDNSNIASHRLMIFSTYNSYDVSVEVNFGIGVVLFLEMCHLSTRVTTLNMLFKHESLILLT